MGNMWKINALQNYATKSDFSKITFKKGDNFSARILRLDGDAKDVVIKLLDGRVFPAKVEGDIEQDKLDNFLFKFELEGFDKGKFILNILEAITIDKAGEAINGIKDPLMEELLRNLNFPIEKEDVPTLKAMLKNNIPITEGNLLEIKGLNELIVRSNKAPEEIDKFIKSFIESKGVSIDSPEGRTMEITLNGVLKELKNFKYDDVLLIKALDVKLTEDNLKAFSKVTSNEYNMLNEVKEINEVIKDGINVNNNERVVLENKDVNEASIKNNIVEGKIDNKNLKPEEQEVTAGIIKEEQVVPKEIIKESIGKLNKENHIIYKELTAVKNELESSNKVGEEGKNLTKGELKEVEIKDTPRIKESLNNVISASIVKEEIKEKISFLKENLMNMIKAEEKSPTTFNAVAQNLESKFQEFKMFNTINNNYYMLNVPMNVKDEEYGCKLIIKDDRGKGKKIDSENIKIAASVDTIHMSRIDAYITISKNVANIEIESERTYTKVLDKFKGKLLEDLADEKYIFNVAVKEKKVDFSFANCRSFFEDEDFTTINTRV